MSDTREHSKIEFYISNFVNSWLLLKYIMAYIIIMNKKKKYDLWYIWIIFSIHLIVYKYMINMIIKFWIFWLKLIYWKNNCYMSQIMHLIFNINFAIASLLIIIIGHITTFIYLLYPKFNQLLVKLEMQNPILLCRVHVRQRRPRYYGPLNYQPWITYRLVQKIKMTYSY